MNLYVKKISSRSDHFKILHAHSQKNHCSRFWDLTIVSIGETTEKTHEITVGCSAGSPQLQGTRMKVLLVADLPWGHTN